jgi:hypothetical protein
MRTSTEPRPVQSGFRTDDLERPVLRIARASTHASHRNLVPGLEEPKPKDQEVLSDSKMWHVATRRLPEELSYQKPVLGKLIARKATKKLPSEPLVRTDTLPRTSERVPAPSFAEVVLIR